jgi:hypothetical protein
MDLLTYAASYADDIHYVEKSPKGCKIIKYLEDINDALDDEELAHEHREGLRRDALRESVTPRVGCPMKQQLAEIRLPKRLLNLKVITPEEFRDVVNYIRYGN